MSAIGRDNELVSNKGNFNVGTPILEDFEFIYLTLIFNSKWNHLQKTAALDEWIVYEHHKLFRNYILSLKQVEQNSKNI